MVIDGSDWETLTQGVGDYVEAMYPNKDFTFKVMAKRADKNYPMTSPEYLQQDGCIFA